MTIKEIAWEDCTKSARENSKMVFGRTKRRKRDDAKKGARDGATGKIGPEMTSEGRKETMGEGK